MAIDKRISELPVATGISATDISVIVRDSNDYQFSFLQLLDFISGNTFTGADISFGNVLPQNTSGKNGDVFFNAITGVIHKKINGVWVNSFIPATNNITSSSFLYESGEPADSSGNDNDSYIDIGTGLFYKKTDGEWAQVFSMASGPGGPRGNSVLNGTSDPANNIGVNEDFYLNTTTLNIFGPKASGVWPTGTSIKGTDANTLLNGLGSPSNSIGNNGDFYLDTNTYEIYGPKAGNDWPEGNSLIYTLKEPVVIEIPEGSSLPYVIDYAENYSEYGNEPVLIVDMIIDTNRRRIVHDIIIEKNYSVGILNTIHIYGHDSGDGLTTIDDLILTIKI